MTTPSSRTRECRALGTDEPPISSTKMNRLSRDRLYSVSQPAKNWPAAAGWPSQRRLSPNSTDPATTTAV
jgi:hypothetical protein